MKRLKFVCKRNAKAHNNRRMHEPIWKFSRVAVTLFGARVVGVQSAECLSEQRWKPQFMVTRGSLALQIVQSADIVLRATRVARSRCQSAPDCLRGEE